MHFFLQLQGVGNGIRSCSLPFRDVIAKWMETSITLYPRKHAHYSPGRLNPLATGCWKCLLLQMNTSDKACCVYPADFGHLLQPGYHFSIIRPRLYCALLLNVPYPVILQKWSSVLLHSMGHRGGQK